MMEVKNAVQGDWVIMAVTKIWYSMEYPLKNDKITRGMTAEYPFGHEILLALPCVETPTDPVPDGCMTREQFDIVMREFIAKESK